MIRIGLTGGIASGKSTVGEILARLGARIFDADRIVAELYDPGNPGARAVEELFGREFFSVNGAVDKGRLAGKVFADSAARSRLESAIHPLIVEEIRKLFSIAEKKGTAVAVAEASQIFEGGYENEFDRVALVVSPEIIRMKRWREKGLDPEELARRMAAQVVENEARRKADDVIVNAGTVEELRLAVERLYAGWIAPDRKV
ncbi:MAG: dephospho-CoA kinase [Thermoanaerobaculia bacterium]